MQKKVMKKLAALSGNLPKLLKANTDYEQSRTLLRYTYRIDYTKRCAISLLAVVICH